MIVLGENKKFAAALISPDFTYLRSWCKAHKIPFTTQAEMIDNMEVQKRFQEEVKNYNKLLGDTEQIKRYQLVAEEWTQPAGFLSPTLKIKRKILEEFYSDKIERLFA